MAALPSAGNFKQTLTLENTKTNAEVSFSSYLNKSEEAFVRRLAADSIRPQDEDAEIGVFSAEKYFNGSIDEPSPISSRNRQDNTKKGSKCDEGNKEVSAAVKSSNSGTPSSKSESSWNSNSLLLKSSFRISSNKKKPKSLLSGLSCRCYCSDKESVDVKEGVVGELSFRGNQVPGTRIPEENPGGKDIENLRKVKKETRFSFQTTPETILSGVEEPKLWRKSINLKDTIAPTKSIAVRKMEEPEDYESDASSDLFEIESIAGGNNVGPFLARQGSGVAPGCITPTYPPSEVSVDWSVVTASAADFSVDYEEVRVQSPRRRSLMGCKRSEAVSPAYRAKGGAVKAAAEVRFRSFRASDSFPRPGLTFQAGRKLSGTDSRFYR